MDLFSHPASVANRTPNGCDFYVTGGTLRPDAPCYIERQADKDLYEGLLRGEFCYVLTSRQMGKSSLMVRTVMRLRQEGVAVAVLDLTAIGQNLTIEQWYDGLISRLGQQLDLEDELLAFWQAHPEWGPLQRWLSAIEQVVLKRCSGQVVIFVDEIDIVRSLPFSTDEFFAAIRECYNRRAREPIYGRLAFGLLGVATPTDLIRNTRMTPFNIGRRIELNDFTAAEASVLAKGLGPNEQTAQALLTRVLYWTGGHPYLTQRLCRALAELLRPPTTSKTAPSVPPVLPTVQTVDQMADNLFLSRQARDRDDNLIFVRERILRSETDVAGLLYVYRKVRTGQAVPDDETNRFHSVLRLSGITRGINGYLQVRNRIYSHVFDPAWIQANMPGAEVRRQRKAGRLGIVRGLLLALLVFFAYHILSPRIARLREVWLAKQTVQRLLTTYERCQSYQDTFTTQGKLVLGSLPIPFRGSGSIVFDKPNKVNLTLTSTFYSADFEARCYSDGRTTWVYEPTSRQYQVRNSSATFALLPTALAQQVGPMHALPLYRILLGNTSTTPLRDQIQRVQYRGNEQVEGQHTRWLSWDHLAAPFLQSLGLTNQMADPLHFPVEAWVDPAGLVVRLKADLSAWTRQILGGAPDIPVGSLVLVETHKDIQTSDTPAPFNQFIFKPTPEMHAVAEFNLSAPNLRRLVSPFSRFVKFIPARLPQTPPELIDLTEYYNASLEQDWHPGIPHNHLSVLPRGLLYLGGEYFDVRGIVQLFGRPLRGSKRPYPDKVTGIKINVTGRKIHFLHATGWKSREGTHIGSYRLHYANGQEHEIPIIYGEDVRDWNAEGDNSTQLKRAEIVWTDTNKAGLPVRLFKSTWQNPWPDVPIVSLDYRSTVAEAAPFLIAITMEP